MKMLRSIVSVVLMTLVLISSTSFIVGVHHCNGRVHDVSLLSDADECPMERQLPPCHKPKNSCCTNERIIHEADDFNASVAPSAPEHSPLVAELAPPVVIAFIIPERAASFHTFDAYSPPDPSGDLNVVFSIFRI